MRIEHRRALGAPHGADDALEAIAIRGDEMLRRITKAETQQRRHATPFATARPIIRAGPAPHPIHQEQYDRTPLRAAAPRTRTNAHDRPGPTPIRRRRG